MRSQTQEASQAFFGYLQVSALESLATCFCKVFEEQKRNELNSIPGLLASLPLLVFLPVFQWIAGAAVFDCEPTGEGPCDVAALRALVADLAGTAEVLEVTIDGELADDVFAYRASSPEFAVEYPDDDIVSALFGLPPEAIPAGTYFPNVADGYWMILTPLMPGEHTIEVHVEAPDSVGVFDVIWNLTVE